MNYFRKYGISHYIDEDEWFIEKVFFYKLVNIADIVFKHKGNGIFEIEQIKICERKLENLKKENLFVKETIIEYCLGNPRELNKRYKIKSNKIDSERNNKKLDKQFAIIIEALSREDFKNIRLKNDKHQYFFITNKAKKNSCNSLTVKELIESVLYLNDSDKVKRDLELKQDEELVDYLFKIAERYLEVNQILNKSKTQIDIIIDDQQHLNLDENLKDRLADIVIDKKSISARSEREKQKAIEKANYRCEINKDHIFFISKKTNKNYVEGHHLIPLKFRNDFKYSLDVSDNIVSLCVICHGTLHYGILEEKKKILDKLYRERESQLKRLGLLITKETLYNYYSNDIEEG